MRGIASYAHERGNWHVFSAPEGEEYAVFSPGGYQWDGLIIRPAGGVFIRRVMKLKVPVVSVGSLVVQPPIPRVKVNDRENTALILRHLLNGGIKRFGYCSFFPNLMVEDRGRAFIENVRASGYGCSVFNQFAKLRVGDSWQTRLRQLTAWLKQLSKPVGIACYTPYVACQLVDACNRAGIAVPDEVAVIAADDDPMKCELSRPTVTAAEIPASRIGFEAASLLDRMINGYRGSSLMVEVPPTGVIVMRESTALRDLADREVRQADELLRKMPPGELSVKKLSEKMLVSERWLQRHFQRVFGITPSQRMAEIRLESAKRLLLETDWPAVRIARQSGFYSASHLNRVIRKETGVTPGEFRRRHRFGR